MTFFTLISNSKNTNMTNKEKKDLLELGIAAVVILGVSAWYKWMSRKEETIVVVEENDNRYCPMCGWMHAENQKVCRNPRCGIRF